MVLIFALTLGRGQELAQVLVVVLHRLRQLAVPIFALKVGVQPVLLVLRDVVALVADAEKVRRTHGVHALEAPPGDVLAGVRGQRSVQVGLTPGEPLLLLCGVLGLSLDKQKRW